MEKPVSPCLSVCIFNDNNDNNNDGDDNNINDNDNNITIVTNSQKYHFKTNKENFLVLKLDSKSALFLVHCL